MLLSLSPRGGCVRDGNHATEDITESSRTSVDSGG